MKVNLIRDEKGNVIATFERARPGQASITPVLKPGHTVEEVEATENYRTDLKAFYSEHSKKGR